MEASTFVPLAEALAPEWRVIALDQRGHGYSDHASHYSRDAYVRDLEAWLDHLRIPESVVFLGNSLGGINAMHFAALHPQRVRALIIEDIGAEVTDDVSFILAWAGHYPTREALEAKVGPRFTPYLRDSFRQDANGWRLAFEPVEMVQSQKELMGEHWEAWKATNCPALLIRGETSILTSHVVMERMVACRKNSTLVTLPAGHVVHMDCPAQFHETVRAFLAEI
jgi:pimeloyl-ACP methyl ester carboxylesterase